tara:strand:+ start:199 stop:543 length:345 start_codon:yes stop_codon:yes gene_type:complete
MATRKELLQHLWDQEINAYLRDDVLGNIVQDAERNPEGALSDGGLAIKRLMDAGASRRDLSLAFRSIAYETVFSTLYALTDPGADNDDVLMLHEELLSADPSGMEGRPGSGDIA